MNRNRKESLKVGVERADDAVDRAFSRLRGNATADRLFYVASEAAD
jgi:hypothetical protein